MKKFNTLLFKDPSNNYYLADVDNYKVIGFNLMQALPEATVQAIEAIKEPFNTSDFIIVSVKHTKKNVEIKPIKAGTVIAGDNPVQLYDIPREELINLFNSLVDLKRVK